MRRLDPEGLLMGQGKRRKGRKRRALIAQRPLDDGSLVGVALFIPLLPRMSDRIDYRRQGKNRGNKKPTPRETTVLIHKQLQQGQERTPE